MIKPPENVLALPPVERGEMAMKGAMGKVIEEHGRAKLPLYIWRHSCCAFPRKSCGRNCDSNAGRTRLDPFTVPYFPASSLLYFFVCLLKSWATLSRSSHV
jgi:hypothetical protein